MKKFALLFLILFASLAPIQFFTYQPVAQAEAGILSKFAKGYVSARILKSMFSHASPFVRDAARRKFFDVIKQHPDLAEKAYRMVREFAASSKAQKMLASHRGTEIKRELEETLVRLAAWNRPVVQDGKLAGFLKNLYRQASDKGGVGSGSTADALRYERMTGQMVGGRSHLQKVKDSIGGLENWLASNRSAAAGDIKAVNRVLDDLYNAAGLTR